MQLGVWGIGAYLILTGTDTRMSYGVLATFIAYVASLAGPLTLCRTFFPHGCFLHERLSAYF